MYNIEVIPYNNFKQRIKLVEEFKHMGCKIEISEGYICVTKFNVNWNDGVAV